MYVLDETYYFWFLAVIPVIILLYLALVFWQKKAQKKFAEPQLLKTLTPDKSRFKSVLKIVLISLAIAFFVLALVNPKMGSKVETINREGVDIVFALDVSKSMLAEDISPNRIQKSKRIINQLIDNLSGDRVGIIGYAGSAFPQIPITTDYAAAKTFLRSMDTDMVSSQGTATKDAIELAQTYYNDETKVSKVLIILSDGEDHEQTFEEAVQNAANEGIKIITIGVGTEKGGPIPIRGNSGELAYKKDKAGETVITRADIKTLKRIAEIGNGKYIEAQNTSTVIEEVINELANLEKAEFESKQYADFKHRFQWFLGFGIVFLVLDILLLERKTKWVEKLNLFNERKQKDDA
ncbi:MAG: vWA domain-containing protein [Bacteroidota bacterium]